MHFRFIAPAQPQIACALPPDHVVGHSLGLRGIAGRIADHFRNRAHHGHIFRRVMAHAQASVYEAAAHAYDLHVRLVVHAVVPDLFQRTEHRKVADGINQYGPARGRQAGSHADHALFRDAGVNQPVRKAPVDLPEHAKAQVARNQDDPLVLLHLLLKDPRKRVSHGLIASSSFSAASYSSPWGVR